METILEDKKVQQAEKLNVFIADSGYDEKWMKFLDNHPEGTIYHHPLWLKILENESGQKIIKLVCTNQNDELIGIFPLQYTKGFPFGLGGVPGAKRLSSLPRSPIGGPLTINASVSKVMLGKAMDLVKDDNQRFLQIKSFESDLNDDIESLIKYFWRDFYIKEIPDYPEEIRFGNSRNHASVKRAVNKAKKNGVTFRIADSPDDLKKWYPLYLNTMRTHTTPARSFNFYKNQWELLRPNGLMQLVVAEVERNGEKIIIAGSVLYLYNKTVVYAFNGSSADYLDLRPNDILHWQAIFNAQKDGYKYYDLGEVSKENAGLAAYKKKWGADVWKMYHYYFPKPEKLNTEDLDNADASGLTAKIWKAIPLNITAKIGEYVYKKL